MQGIGCRVAPVAAHQGAHIDTVGTVLVASHIGSTHPGIAEMLGKVGGLLLGEARVGSSDKQNRQQNCGTLLHCLWPNILVGHAFFMICSSIISIENDDMQ